MWVNYNPNPVARNVGDCSIRALCRALNVSWETAFAMAVKNAFSMCDMPSSDAVWGSVLRQHDFYKSIVPNTCPECYTIKQFCTDNPKGIFVIGTGGHVVTAVDGHYYDTWDSGNEIPIYYWTIDQEDNDDGL